MTATIVTEFSRDPYDPATVFKFGANGDVKRRDTPGQLWERVAERGTNYAAQSTIRYAGRQAGIWGTRARDYALRENFTRSARGIIRAGVRIK